MDNRMSLYYMVLQQVHL